jgi:hypothetical protein
MFVLLDEAAKLTVNNPRIAPGGHGRIGLGGKSVNHLLGSVAPVSQDSAMVDRRHPGGVPGVGGLPGAGLTGVAPVGVQR